MKINPDKWIIKRTWSNLAGRYVWVLYPPFNTQLRWVHSVAVSPTFEEGIRWRFAAGYRKYIRKYQL